MTAPPSAEGHPVGWSLHLDFAGEIADGKSLFQVLAVENGTETVACEQVNGLSWTNGVREQISKMNRRFGDIRHAVVVAQGTLLASN